MDPRRDKLVARVLWLILVANAAVAGVKLTYGFLVGSLAVQADGLHSTVDGSNNVVALLILRLAARPADASHPYGHRKFEGLGSLAIGAMIVLLLVRVAVGAAEALTNPRPVHLGPEAYAIMLLTLAINIVVAAYERRAGTRLASPLLLADAQHTLSDVFVTAAVLTGIFGVRSGFDHADALASLAVLLPLGWAGYSVLRRAVAILADEAVIAPGEIERAVTAVPGIRECLHARSRGPQGDVRVDLTATVDPAMTVAKAHQLADAIEGLLKSRFPAITEVVVHIEPAEP